MKLEVTSSALKELNTKFPNEVFEIVLNTGGCFATFFNLKILSAPPSETSEKFLYIDREVYISNSAFALDPDIIIDYYDSRFWIKCTNLITCRCGKSIFFDDEEGVEEYNFLKPEGYLITDECPE